MKKHLLWLQSNHDKWNQPQSQVALKLIDASIEQGWGFNSQNTKGFNALMRATRYAISY